MGPCNSTVSTKKSITISTTNNSTDSSLPGQTKKKLFALLYGYIKISSEGNRKFADKIPKDIVHLIVLFIDFVPIQQTFTLKWNQSNCQYKPIKPLCLQINAPKVPNITTNHVEEHNLQSLQFELQTHCTQLTSINKLEMSIIPTNLEKFASISCQVSLQMVCRETGFTYGNIHEFLRCHEYRSWKTWYSKPCYKMVTRDMCWSMDVLLPQNRIQETLTFDVFIELLKWTRLKGSYPIGDPQKKLTHPVYQKHYVNYLNPSMMDNEIWNKAIEFTISAEDLNCGYYVYRHINKVFYWRTHLFQKNNIDDIGIQVVLPYDKVFEIKYSVEMHFAGHSLAYKGTSKQELIDYPAQPHYNYCYQIYPSKQYPYYHGHGLERYRNTLEKIKVKFQAI